MRARAHKKCAHHRAYPFAGILNAILRVTNKHATRHTELNSITKAIHVRAYKKHAHRRARCLPEILHCSQWRRLIVFKSAPLYAATCYQTYWTEFNYESCSCKSVQEACSTHRRARCLPEILHCSQWRRLIVVKSAPLYAATCYQTYWTEFNYECCSCKSVQEACSSPGAMLTRNSTL